MGVAPQHGLYTVLIAAPLIALTRGSRFNVSGPTAAFVVILLPITQQFGIAGLLLCTMLAGLILIALGVLRASKLIAFVPYPVTLGFTAGIGIAALQLKDVLGLTLTEQPQHYVEQLGLLVRALPSAQAGDGLVAALCLSISATNVRAGAFSLLAAIIHAGVVLVAILRLAPLFSYLPMAALAALLLMVAWNMSEAPHVLKTLRIAPRSDVLVLLTCLILAVMFDMVLAVEVGLLLAAGLFVKRMSELTDTTCLRSGQGRLLQVLPEHVAAYAIRGPLFFGAAEKALSVLRRFNPEVKIVIVDISGVPMLDMTALAALENVLLDYRKQGIALILCGSNARVRLKLRRAGIHLLEGQLHYVRDLAQARAKALRLLPANAVTAAAG